MIPSPQILEARRVSCILLGPLTVCSGQALGVRILKQFLSYGSAVEMKTPENLKPGKEGARFVTMQPGKQSHYVGVVSKDKDIKPLTIGGTWYPKRPTPGTASDVILHFHGGKVHPGKPHSSH